MPILLELLKAFPEEAQSKHLRIGENRRRAVNAELSQQTSSVLNFLVGIFLYLKHTFDGLSKFLIISKITSNSFMKSKIKKWT